MQNNLFLSMTMLLPSIIPLYEKERKKWKRVGDIECHGLKTDVMILVYSHKDSQPQPNKIKDIQKIVKLEQDRDEKLNSF